MIKKRTVLKVLALPGAAVLLYLLFTFPTHDGDWQVLQARLPEVSVAGDAYRIHHIRDFSYRSDHRIRTVRYQEQEYALKDLRRIWLGLSHFSGYGLAHSFLSFEFEDGRYLVASVEARMRPGQSYSPFAGMLRRYPKIIVLGTERDVVGLRSRIRQERVLLYPLELTEAQRRHVFTGMMQDVQQLREKPSFYNTLLDNCTTGLLRHDPEHRFWRNLFDYRLLLPGFSDGYALEKGWIRTDRDLQQWRKHAAVSAAFDPEAADFSRKIRSVDRRP